MSDPHHGGGMTPGKFFAWGAVIGGVIYFIFLMYGMALEELGMRVGNFAAGFRYGKSELIFVVLVIALTVASIGALITMISLGKLGAGKGGDAHH